MTEIKTPLRNVSLGDLADGLVAVPETMRGIRVTGLAYDSRRVRPGDLYCGLVGATTHGAAFADQAKASGAVAMLTDAAGSQMCVDQDLPVLVADNPRRAMGQLAARLCGDPTNGRLTLGVTGTTGKTTVSFMLADALRAGGRHAGYIGTLGFTLDGEQLPLHKTTPTTPESVDLQESLAAMAGLGADSFVMEATSAGLLLDRLEGVRFDVVGFTNLGRDHLDFHPTMEDYFLAKAKLFRPRWASQAVVDVDSEWGVRLLGIIRRDGGPAVTTIGHGLDADWRITGHYPADGHQMVEVVHQGRMLRFSLDMLGDFNAVNAVMALAMADAAGLSGELVVQGLAHTTVPGRMEKVDLGAGAPPVIVDLSNTPEATEALLRSMSRPVIALIGSGGDRDPGKRALIGAAAARQADVVIVADDNPRTEDPGVIRQAILDGAVGQASQLADGPSQIIDGGGRPQAVKLALSMAEPGWTVAILGRGDEEFQELAGLLIPMLDTDLVKEAWLELKERSA